MNDYRQTSTILPPVVKNLLIINGICFAIRLFVEYRYNYDLNDLLGLYFPSSPAFKPFQLLSHVFMHGSFMHLFFNMFSLWMFGSVLENYWGGKRFFIYYFITAFGAAALYLGVNGLEIFRLQSAIDLYAQSPDPGSFLLFVQDHKGLISPSSLYDLEQFARKWTEAPADPAYVNQSMAYANQFVQLKMSIPVVGASGAVFGLLLAFGMLFPNTELMMIFLPIPIKAKFFVMIYGGLELYQGIANNPSDNVAHFAHLGGMLFGFIMIRIWNRNRFKKY